MKSTKIKSKVFAIAWQIIKGGYALTFKEALKKAWSIIKMSLGVSMRIEFAKETTGELRTATVAITGGLDTIKQGFVRFVEMVEGKAQWRSFRIANLITQ